MNPTPTYIAVLAEALVAALNPQLATMDLKSQDWQTSHPIGTWPEATA